MPVGRDQCSASIIGSVQATINGVRQQISEGETLLTLVERLGLKPDRLAIELDRKIVKPPVWATTAIQDGAEIEIVHFVGGGAGASACPVCLK
jgi:thiamine biosynthesis protein ThiS